MAEIFDTIQLEDGRQMRLKLRRDVAPISVDNFVKLAEEKYYDGLCFHRVIDKFMIQGGGFTAGVSSLRSARELEPIKGEFESNGVPNALKHKKGVISMARTPLKDSATSQFFICVDDTPFLDGEYAAFGECVDEESKNTAVAIGKVPTHTLPYGYGDVPVTPVVIKTVVIEKK